MKFVAAALFALLPAFSALAGQPVEKEVKIARAEAGDRWSIGAGAAFRQVWADFHMRTPSSGLFFHVDGAVFEQDADLLLRAYGVERAPLRRADPSGLSLSELLREQFYSGESDSQEDVGTGAYLQLRYAAWELPRAKVNLLFGYSWLPAELAASGRMDGARPAAPPSRAGRIGFATTLVSGGGIFVPRPTFLISPVLIPPRPTRDHDLTVLFVRSNPKLDLALHEIVLAPEMEFRLADRLRAALAVGPTLNVIDGDLHYAVNTYVDRRRVRNGRVVDSYTERLRGRTYRVHERSTDLRVGGAAQVNLTFDITKRVFLEVASSYRYVPSFTVGSKIVDAEIDASSWESKVGFGFRF